MQGGIHPDFTGVYQSMSCVGNVQLCNPYLYQQQQSCMAVSM